MSIVKKSSIATAFAAVIALGTVNTAPATAGLLKFNFDTESGGTGSFTLDTETAPASEPVLFGPGLTGFLYPNAVSDFFLSAPYIDSLNKVTADYSVVPSFPLTPDGKEVFSGVSYPAGCSRAATFNCLVNVAISYSGNVLNLPLVLSSDSLSYSKGIGVEVFDPTVGIPTRDNITNLEAVPEPDSVLGLLAFGIGGALLQLLRMNRNKAVIKP